MYQLLFVDCNKFFTTLKIFNNLDHWESSLVGTPPLPPGKFSSPLLLPPLPVQVCCILSPAHCRSSARTQHLQAAK